MSSMSIFFREEFDLILERALISYNDETGEKSSIVIQIGQPYWSIPNLEGSCPLNISGLLDRRSDIKGIDPLNAIENAILFADNFLKNNPKIKKLFWESGEEYEPTTTRNSNS